MTTITTSMRIYVTVHTLSSISYTIIRSKAEQKFRLMDFMTRENPEGYMAGSHGGTSTKCNTYSNQLGSCSWRAELSRLQI